MVAMVGVRRATGLVLVVVAAVGAALGARKGEERSGEGLGLAAGAVAGAAFGAMGGVDAREVGLGCGLAADRLVSESMTVAQI